MPGIEAAAQQTLLKVATRLLGAARQRHERRKTRAEARTLTATRVADQLLDELSEDERLGLDDYLRSPDFEEVALQLVLGLQLGDVKWERLSVDIRDELRLGLRRAAGIRAELLTTAADVVFDALVVAGREAVQQTGPALAAVAGRLSALAAANSKLLGRIENLAEIHRFGELLRDQVVALHGEIRLPHLGLSRSAPYEQLYVEPSVRPENEVDPVPRITELAHPCHRTVILGDPGAGKSTLATKLAHDVAADRFPGAEGRVPFLLVLRSFAASFREGGSQLLRYLEKACQDPYNLRPPEHAVDYLLRNGRAVVILDGLDELVESELRRRVVQLVEGFVHRYPLVPVLVTARKVGYADAPLSAALFQVGVVAELDDERIASYAGRWFALDPAAAPAERGQLAKSFIAESANVRELCRNTLILALLCAMYSSEHYLPRNLAQVYERCSTMLFERWDTMRGIELPVQFHGRLRGAVQHLAWQQYSSAPADGAPTRTRVVRILADYLMSKQFDEDDAAQTAEEFIRFCAGRAWILTDVGATETEPRYGFTHRTFLEYFAAEHLVRRHPAVEDLWDELLPGILVGEGELLGQIAIQLFDRNVEDGADKFVTHVLSRLPADPEGVYRVRTFLARCLGYCQPGRHTVRTIAEAALRACLATGLATRFSYRLETSPDGGLVKADKALQAVMYDSLPGNVPTIRRTILETLDASLGRNDPMAMFVLHNFSRRYKHVDERRVKTWADVGDELRAKHGDALESWQNQRAWYTDGRPQAIRESIDLHGPRILYMHDYFLTGSKFSYAESCYLDVGGRAIPQDEAKLLCRQLTRASRPWLPAAQWWDEYTGDDALAPWAYGFSSHPDAAESPLCWLLMLPYLEMMADHGMSGAFRHADAMYSLLFHGRRETTNPAGSLVALHRARLSKRVRSFLEAWVRHEISVLPPREPA